ncbi:MAG: histidine kinase [Ignavibacteria bacterium]|jgi:ligand-binding sensor domain-containing protein/two-component sensor histidine kinase|nr:histidine kinase [Ignavibacteria bacterium]MCU7517578.1 histidine kinase [Ignavibacteria bacterium]
MKKFLPSAVICLLLFLLPSAPDNLLLAQGNLTTFEHISIEQGLSQSSINAIIQDFKGFIWIATADGLDRYDGYSFKIFRNIPQLTGSLSDNSVSAVYEDRNGNLWAGTLLGNLNKYDRRNERFIKYSFGSDSGYTSPVMNAIPEYPLTFSRFNDRTITAISGDSKGNLWIATWGQGLFSFEVKTGKVKHFTFNPKDPHSISSNRIVTLMEDKNGILWAGTFGGGLNRIERKTGSHPGEITLYVTRFQNIPMLQSTLSDNRVTTIFQDGNGSLWAGTFGGGLNKIPFQFVNETNPARVKFIHYRNIPQNKSSLSSNWVMNLIQDRTGVIWIATFGGGLNRMDPNSETFTVFKNDPVNPGSLSDNDVISLFEDRSGIIWIGTHLGKGINRYDRSRNKFPHYSHIPGDPTSLSDNVVWAFSEDKQGAVWIGTYRGGLNRFDRQTHKFRSYRNIPSNPNSISSNHVRAVFIDKDDNIWAGTYNAGLNFFDRKTGKFTAYKHNPSDPASISDNQVISILEDSHGNLWAGTFGGGLNKVVRNKGKFSFIHFKNNPSDPHSLADNRVYKIYEDRHGNLWIGTFGGGLSKLDPSTGTFTNFRHDPNNPNSLSDNRVICVYEDFQGTIWLGTYGGGLNRFDPSTGKFYKYMQGRSLSGVVYGILEDNEHNFWISSDNGLSRFTPSTSAFINYDLHDGLQSMEFSGGAYYKTRSGEMYFGGINGFNSFYPDSIRVNTHVPPVVISAFRIFNKEVDGESDEIILSSKENFFSFEFAALDYTNPEQNRYAYKLEGFDDDWHYVDASRRLANYTNLDPGNYVFRVRGSNNDGIWNNTGAEVRITILPPFYRTWWFILLSVVLIGGTLSYFIVSRIRQLLAIERLKTKLAADLHDNIGSGLTEISILSQVIVTQLNKNTDDVKQKLLNISETSGQLIDNMSDIVWVVNPKRDTLYDLILRLKDSYSEIFSSLGVSFKIHNLESLINVKLPMEYRQNLFLIFKEAINNSLKHSECKKLDLATSIEGRKLKMELADDGKGFDMKQNTPGNGLNNIRRRAKAIGGSLMVESAPGKGTRISFFGKIPRSNTIFMKHKEQ